MLELKELLDYSWDQIIQAAIRDHKNKFKRGVPERDNNIKQLQQIIEEEFNEPLGRMDEQKKSSTTPSASSKQLREDITKLKTKRDNTTRMLDQKRKDYADMIENVLTENTRKL